MNEFLLIAGIIASVTIDIRFRIFAQSVIGISLMLISENLIGSFYIGNEAMTNLLSLFASRVETARGSSYLMGKSRT